MGYKRGKSNWIVQYTTKESGKTKEYAIFSEEAFKVCINGALLSVFCCCFKIVDRVVE